MSLPEISRGREKAQFLKEVYDVTFTGGEARQNLWKKAIPKKEKSDKAQEWMREERQRAEERAEIRWRQKFEEWQASYESAQLAPREEEENREAREAREASRIDVPPAESPKALDKEQQAWKARAEAAEEELEELRSECKGQLTELERLYEEFRRVRRDAMDERKQREKIEEHLQMVAQDHEAWRLRTEQRESQLQQARSQRRSVASRIALFGNKLLDLERDTDGFIAQAAADRGQEPTRTNEGVTALDLAEKALKNAKAANEDMAKFLSSEEVEAIHTTDATTPRNPEELIGAEDASPADSPQHREESHITEHEDTSPADSPQHGEESHITEHEDTSPADSPQHREESHITEHEDTSPADSPQHGEESHITEHEDTSPADSPQHREESHITEHEDTSPADSPQHGEENHITEHEDTSPADSPQHREESHITQHEDTSPADSPQHGEENHITEHEVQDDERAVERPATEGRQSAVSYTEGDWAGDEEYACAQAVARNLVSELYLKAQVKLAKDLNGQP